MKTLHFTRQGICQRKCKSKRPMPAMFSASKNQYITQPWEKSQSMAVTEGHKVTCKTIQMMRVTARNIIPISTGISTFSHKQCYPFDWKRCHANVKAQ